MKFFALLSFFFFQFLAFAQSECLIAYQSEYFIVNKTGQDVVILRNNKDLVNFPTAGPDTIQVQNGATRKVGEFGWAEHFVNPVRQFVFRTIPGGLTPTCVPYNWVFRKESETRGSYTLELSHVLQEPCPEDASELYWVNEEERESQMVIDFPDSTAEYPGGMTALMKYMRENISYPDSFIADGIMGTVYVEFVVNINGSINDIKVIRTPHQALSDEAMRLIAHMPNWKPAKFKGKDVRSKMRLPIRFQLDEIFL